MKMNDKSLNTTIYFSPYYKKVKQAHQKQAFGNTICTPNFLPL